MCDDILKNQKTSKDERIVLKLLLENLCSQEYSEVCCALARLVLLFVGNTECELKEIVGNIDLPANNVSLDRSCGILGGLLSLYATTADYEKRKRLLRDMVAVSGFDFEKILDIALRECDGGECLTVVDANIRDVLLKIISVAKNK